MGAADMDLPPHAADAALAVFYFGEVQEWCGTAVSHTGCFGSGAATFST